MPAPTVTYTSATITNTCLTITEPGSATTNAGSAGPNAESSVSDAGSCVAVPIKRRPLVLIFYSDDHPAHCDAIRQLATFLQAYCGCQVILDMWNVVQMAEDVISWHFRQLEKAGKVLFVHSEGAFYKYQAHIMRKQSLIDLSPPPKGDPFLQLLPHVQKRVLMDSGRYLMVRFSYTQSQFLIGELCYSSTYVLPDDMHELVLRIHGEAKHGFGFTTSILSVNVKEAAKLQHTIRKADDFTKSNPCWFQQRFRNADSNSGSDGDGDDTDCDGDGGGGSDGVPAHFEVGHENEAANCSDESSCSPAHSVGSLVPPDSDCSSVLDTPEHFLCYQPISDNEFYDSCYETIMESDIMEADSDGFVSSSKKGWTIELAN